MIIPAVATLVLASAAVAQNAQFVGTWSSGSQQVVTGPGFAAPANQSFTYPKVTGISFSFTDDGWYEIARYRFVSNGTEPNCIKGVIGWVHGKYALQTNGSLVMTPNGDGYQQVQDPCAAVSNFIENYNITELYQTYAFITDTEGTKLQLFQFDGSPLAPMTQVSTTPNMLPTRQLRNVTAPEPGTSTTDGLTTQNLLVNTNGASTWHRFGTGGALALLITLGAVSSLL